jgi:cytidine deaminase
MAPEELIKKAIIAQKQAVAPYSNYPVGAALLTDNDSIILGCNIESKAYPTTLCAERVAIFSAISQGYKKFSAMALITRDGAYPCGSCRQIIHEYAGNIPIYIAKDVENYVTQTISDLLPFPFG